MIKLCKPQMEQNMDAIIDRLNQIEDTLVHGHPVGSIEAAGQEAVQQAMEAAPRPKLKRAELPKAVPEDVKAVVSNFRSIVSEVNSGLAREYLNQARLNLSGEKLQIVFSEELGYLYFQEDGELDELAELISQRVGKQVDVEIAYNDTNRPYEESFVDLEKLIHMEVTIEEE